MINIEILIFCFFCALTAFFAIFGIFGVVKFATALEAYNKNPKALPLNPVTKWGIASGLSLFMVVLSVVIYIS